MFQHLLRRISCAERAIVLVIVGCLMPQAAEAADRLPAQALLDPSNGVRLANYVRERLIKIAVTARDKKTKKDVIQYGTGFLVSTTGLAITAGHVLKPYADVEHFELVPNANKPNPVDIQKAFGPKFFTIQIDTSFSPRFSDDTDIVLFKVKTETDLSFDLHLCVDTGDPRLRLSDSKQHHVVSVAAWRQADGQLQSYPITITNTSGPTLPDSPGNGLSERWVAKEQFYNSMSGGAVLLDGKVIGVIVGGLQDKQTGGDIATAANYISLLHFANDNDIDWRNRSEVCDPTSAGDKFTEFAELSDFLSGTDEGSLAWEFPRGERKFWALSEGNEFVLRRGDLGLCLEDKQSGIAARFVLNHFSRCPGANTGLRTFYGVQVVPIFKKDDAPSPHVTLFRNVNLLLRNRSGVFYKPGTLKNTPLDLNGKMFNDAVATVWKRSPDAPSKKCGSRLDRAQCKDLESIDELEALFGMRWHGFTRDSADAMSTVWGTKWRVPDNWLEDWTSVKNYILRYRGTDTPHTDAKVDFDVCIRPYWSGFYVRTFSPERSCATPIERKIVFRDD